MNDRFPLFNSHLDLAHRYWREVLSPGDIAIDATCGNGHDTLVISQLALTEGSGALWALDIQSEALTNSRSLLERNLPEKLLKRVFFKQACHSLLPAELAESSVKLIVYNLGYRPGGDKAVTTQTETTLKSLQSAEKLLSEGGVISITCYPGHSEGAREESILVSYAAQLPPSLWSCCHHRWLNRRSAPSLLLIQKKKIAI
jgi:hypothetical protein